MVRYRVRMGYGKSIPLGAEFCIEDDHNEITDLSSQCESSQSDSEFDRLPTTHKRPSVISNINDS